MTEQARSLLETLCDEMQSFYDDRSEAWQKSDKGVAFQKRLNA